LKVAEPLTVADLKQQLGIPAEETSFDTLIGSYIPAARAMVENYTGHVLVQREFTEDWRGFASYFELSRRPIIEVSEVAYTDANGDPATYAGFVTSLSRTAARVHPARDGYWPTLGRHGVVSITYTAGYEAGEEPEVLLQAMRLIVGHWFNARETVNIGNIVNEVPFAATALMDQLRMPSL
jgi:uncharacterized phiE125 gp8 family phage protein